MIWVATPKLESELIGKVWNIDVLKHCLAPKLQVKLINLVNLPHLANLLAEGKTPQGFPATQIRSWSVEDKPTREMKGLRSYVLYSIQNISKAYYQNLRMSRGWGEPESRNVFIHYLLISFQDRMYRAPQF